MAHYSIPSLRDYILRYRKPSPQAFLAHHGIEGQKHGIRRGPPYPLSEEQKKSSGQKEVAKVGERDKLNQEVLKKAIESGEVSLKLNIGHQKKHLPDREDKGRSYIQGDLATVQRLVLELSGTGELLPDTKTGEWLKKERVIAADSVGVHVDRKTGKETKTNKLMIIYSKKGTHIYARKDEE